MKKYIINTLLAFVCISSSWAQQYPDMYLSVSLPPKILTYTAIKTTLAVQAVNYESTIVSYKWDIYNDGKTIITSSTSSIQYQYPAAGTYTTSVRVMLADGRSNSAGTQVVVTVGTGTQSIGQRTPITFSTLKSGKGTDGVCTKYALIVCGVREGDPAFFDLYPRTKKLYNILVSQYGYDPQNIFYLAFPPAGESNDVLQSIDYPATIENLTQIVYPQLQQKVQEDDLLFMWIEDHGYGYFNPTVFLNAGDEDPLRAGEFKCRLIQGYHDFYENEFKYKMQVPTNEQPFPLGVWKVYASSVQADGTRKIYREKFCNVDDNAYIERVRGYLLIDAEKDGIITASQIAVKGYMDSDKDGKIGFKQISPYFKGGYFLVDDEDEWNQELVIVPMQDDFSVKQNLTFYDAATNKETNQRVVIFDANKDNKADIDLIPTDIDLKMYEKQLVIRGTDTDNDGIVDGIDLNNDKVQNASYAIDEAIYLDWHPLYASELSKMLSSIGCNTNIVGIACCFSGGFVRKLSAPGRVVFSVTQNQYWGSSGDGDYYVNGIEKTNGIAAADIDKNGQLTMLELYNYAYRSDIAPSTHTFPIKELSYPQYNDNGDGKMYNGAQFDGSILAQASLGCFGNMLTLNGRITTLQPSSETTANITSNKEISGSTITLNNVTLQSTAAYKAHAQEKVMISNFIIQKGATFTIDNNVCK